MKAFLELFPCPKVKCVPFFACLLVAQACMLISNSYSSAGNRLELMHRRSSINSTLSVQERLSEASLRSEADYYEKVSQLRKNDRNFRNASVVAGFFAVLL